ncbi:hypothetical protein LOTGIDRAFT_167913 [Lottia gigantea]|uniref:Uncharacterized protein n=1 Tax=Lottia gigantea TaxID=225164 RepID=V3Z3Y2_LOTGI|nr:hypothetical protein LOTGIDRAFT_167913 [Lottia gigantea]ESO85333.1 hypothetical protein LOTGIDRAFT_167913 [Lottia gigantea]
MSDLHREKDENKTENEDQNDEENDSTQSFTEAVREKYCFDGSDYTFGSCQITFHGKAGTGGAKAELAHLRNVVLCNSNLTYAGIPREGLASLCPNVIDLDISGNNLTSWKEILPIFQQLTHLKFIFQGFCCNFMTPEFLIDLTKVLESDKFHPRSISLIYKILTLIFPIDYK